MPVYEYRCRDCGRDLEAQQEFSDPTLTECPSCGGVLRKRYGSVGVTFNGTGFYRTDSRAARATSGAVSSGADARPPSPGRGSEPSAGAVRTLG